MNLDEFNSNPSFFLKESFKKAVNAAQPSKILSSFLPDLPKGEVLVVGAGKAAASMASAVEDVGKQNLIGVWY